MGILINILYFALAVFAIALVIQLAGAIIRFLFTRSGCSLWVIIAILIVIFFPKGTIWWIISEVIFGIGIWVGLIWLIYRWITKK